MKYFNFFVILIFVFVFVFSFSGCSFTTSPVNSTISNIYNTSSNIDNTSDTFTMELISTQDLDSYSKFHYYRDILTDVIYVRYSGKAGYAGYGGLSPMFHPDTGLPLTYTQYMQIYDDFKLKD